VRSIFWEEESSDVERMEGVEGILDDSLFGEGEMMVAWWLWGAKRVRASFSDRERETVGD